jgi:hypothetical protein
MRPIPPQRIRPPTRPSGLSSGFPYRRSRPPAMALAAPHPRTACYARTVPGTLPLSTEPPVSQDHQLEARPSSPHATSPGSITKCGCSTSPRPKIARREARISHRITRVPLTFRTADPYLLSIRAARGGLWSFSVIGGVHQLLFSPDSCLTCGEWPQLSRADYRQAAGEARTITHAGTRGPQSGPFAVFRGARACRGYRVVWPPGRTSPDS